MLPGMAGPARPGHPSAAMFTATAAVTPAAGAAAASAQFDAAEGARLFSTNCAVCHQEDCTGVPGVFSPTQGNAVVLAADPTQQIRVILNALHGANVGGIVYSSQMSSFASTVRDSQIAEVIDHERASWGNHAPLATAAEIAVARAKDKH